MEQLPLVPEGALLPAPEGTVRAADMVDCAPEHERLRNYLLNDVFICDTLATALLLWARNPGQRTFVSAGGGGGGREGSAPGGARAGGARGRARRSRRPPRGAEGGGGGGRGAGAGVAAPPRQPDGAGAAI